MPSASEAGDARSIVLRDLASGESRHIGNADASAFNEDATHFAYTIDAPDQDGNGLYVLDLETDAIHILDSGRFDYVGLSWQDEGNRLAVLRGSKVEGKQHAQHDVLGFEVGRTPECIVEYQPTHDDDFTQGMVISSASSPRWSEDGSMLFIGIDEQEDEPEKSEDERANVDVWHWDDDRVQSVQQVQANRDRRRTLTAVVHTNGTFVQLADDDMRSVQIVGDGRWGIGRNDAAYRGEVSWGGSRADFYRVDLATGDRSLITMSLGRPMGTSPDGRWFLFLKAGRVMARDLDESKTYDLSDAAGVDFVNRDDDHPYELPARGVAGWTKDGRHVILNHKFDLWKVALDASDAENLTQGVGEAQQIRFRYTQLDREEEWIDLSQPILLSAYGEWTKKSGYYRLAPGESPEPLLYVDMSVGRPIKAEDADVIALTMQTFEQYPDYYITDVDFTAPRKVTDANPQQAEFLWGRRVLVDYENSKGQRLQGTLTLPANYEEGKQYPMLVYFYEKMSQRHHQYSSPRYDDRPHMCTYASDGYLVLMPDVVYEIGRPGDSAVDCVTSAVQAVIDLGYADPERIALQGHSWGGYQSSFILTQTDMFCAVVTGAPVTNLVSFYNELYKRTGTVQQGITEVGQVRMGTTPWDDMELYHSQSPLHNVRNITTPFVILHGTADGAVDWHQGLEYYNAARRNGKEVVLLSYPDEPHHLNKRANQIDFQIRMKDFFDHYCKGTPAPKWWTDGVPYLKKNTTPAR